MPPQSNFVRDTRYELYPGEEKREVSKPQREGKAD